MLCAIPGLISCFDFVVALIWGSVECGITVVELFFKLMSYLTLCANYKYRRTQLRDQRIKGLCKGLSNGWDIYSYGKVFFG